MKWFRAWLGAVVVLGLFPAGSQAALSWSTAVSVNDGQPSSMYGVSCPDASQCTAIAGGLQVTFDPGSPQAWTSYAVLPAQEDTAIACPAASQCTAVGMAGREVTFDPDAAGHAMGYAIDGSRSLEAVACPSVSQCTAVDEDGRVLTFDPAHPAAATAVSLSSATLSAIACPTTSQCTAVDTGVTATYHQVSQSRLVTFDPQAPGVTHAITLAALEDSLACPAASECVAIGGPQQQSVEVDPQTDQMQAPITRSQTPLYSVDCPLVSQCTALTDSGEEATFDPSSTATVSQAPVDTMSECCTTNALGHLACPNATTCVAVAQTYGGAEWTFNPLAPGHPATESIGDAAPLIAVECPLATECTALAKLSAPFLPGGFSSAAATFAPRPHGNPSGDLLARSEPADLACPTASQCTIVTHRLRGSAGNLYADGEVTFNPRGAGRPVSYAVDGASLTGISCPTARQCTAIDTRGRAVTFNPRRPRHLHPVRLAKRPLVGIDCPTRTRCVAVGAAGEVAFDPRAARRQPVRMKLGALSAVSCPSRRECVAVDARGYETTSNANDKTLQRKRIDTHPLTAVSCPTRAFCVAVVRAGRAVEGNPKNAARWTAAALPGASPLAAIDCPTSRLCVAVDSAGHIFTGRS